MFFFKRGRGPFALHESMVGVRMGDRFLQVGVGDGRLFATLAAKVGLTGRACALDADASRAAKARQVAVTAGVLVDVECSPFDRLPFDANAFDVVLMYRVISTVSPEIRVRCLQQTRELLRPGGRCMVIDVTPRGGLGGLFGRSARDTSYVTTGGAERALREEGFAAVRRLADRDGEAFFEGVRKSEPAA